MKKLAFCLITISLLLSFSPSKVKAADEKNPSTTATAKQDVAAETNPETTAEATADLARLEEIKAMDMSAMSRSSKKELRNEVNEIKSKQEGPRGRGHYRHDSYNGRHSGGTFYFVGGGGLLIVLILILLL